ncbi:MAG: Wzz/FepE/Etk N-terminal domain-containing protein [Pseudomonadota bacterium]
MEPSIKLKDVLRMIRRRAIMIVSIVVVFSGLALMLAYFIPPSYTAQAKILIESQQIPQQLASSTVTATATERLELIKQRLMTRANLLNLVDRLELYTDRPDLSKTEKVNLIRSSTRLDKITINTPRSRGGIVSAFTISYRDSNPIRAAKITNEFVTLVLEQNLRARSERAAKTHDFFKEEVAQIEQQLVRTEAEIADFRKGNEAALPDSLAFRRQELATIRKERFDIERRLISLEEERDSIQTALDSGRYAEALDAQLTPEERDLQALQTELSRARSIYAASHPTIRSLETRIATMERNLASTLPNVVPETAVQRANRLKQRLERQLRLLNTDIQLINERLDRGETREGQLVVSIERTPEVGMALNALERRYDDLKIRFEQAVRKQDFAATGEKLEVNRQAERFEVIEQAQVPDRPTSPNRPAIAIGGFAGSLGFALSLALMLGFLNSSIRTVGDMERKLEMRPIITVPYISTGAEKRRARRELWLLGLLFLVIVPVGLYAVDTYYLPLELLIDQFVERANLRGVIARVAEKLGL